MLKKWKQTLKDMSQKNPYIKNKKLIDQKKVKIIFKNNEFISCKKQWQFI